MTINTLKYFVAVAEQGSYSKVASNLFISQPTISRAILSFEEEIGAPLLNRSGKVITRTEAGNIVYSHAKKILDEIERLDTEMKEFKSRHNCLLRIAYHHFDALLADTLLQSLQAMTNLHPEVAISVTDFGSMEMLEQNLLTKVDIAFAPELYVKEMKSVSYRPVYKDPLIAVIPPAHPLALRTSVTCAEVAQSNILLAQTKDSEEGHKRIIASIEKHGTPVKHVSVLPSHDHIHLAMVTDNGIGLMALSILEDRRYNAQNTLRGVPVVDCDMNFDVAMAWREDNPNTARALFIEEITKRCGKNTAAQPDSRTV